MRVYISGPITGVAFFRENFKRAEKDLKEKGYEVINPTSLDDRLPLLEYEEHMKLGITLLDLCDAICMMDGWEESSGANREYAYALAAGKQIMMEE